MQKIRYRLVYNRKHKLNRQGTALVQIEAKLNQRNIYLTTNIYLQPVHWNKSTAQVINHPQAIELNAMLFEFVIHLQAIELGFWKRGIQPTLALLRDAVRKKGHPSRVLTSGQTPRKTCCPLSPSLSSSAQGWTSPT